MQSLMAQSYASQIFLSNLYICEKSASKKMSTLTTKCSHFSCHIQKSGYFFNPNPVSLTLTK